MNTVSWLIYLSYVIPTASVAAVAFLVYSIAMFLVLVVVFLFSSADDSAEGVALSKSLMKWPVFGIIICTVTACVLPDQKTMYMIAASEMSEEVIFSDEAKELYTDLKDILKTYKEEVTK